MTMPLRKSVRNPSKVDKAQITRTKLLSRTEEFCVLEDELCNSPTVDAFNSVVNDTFISAIVEMFIPANVDMASYSLDININLEFHYAPSF